MKYRAFVSYSHRDSKVADWLHKALETYRVPGRLVGRETPLGPVPRRLLPIFRDREELPTSPDLGGSIKGALAESGHLVVICSPAAAKSIWVDEEIRQFKAMHGGGRVLALVAAGAPNGSDDPATAEEECFPPGLRYEVDAEGRLTERRAEPIAADLRDHADGRANALLKLVAGMIGVGFDDLRQRERRRRRARAMQAAAALAVVLAGSGWLWTAWRQETRVADLKREALTAEAEFSEGRLEPALRRLVLALPEEIGARPGPETAAPLDALARMRFESAALAAFRDHDNGVVGGVFTPDGAHVVSLAAEGHLRRWNVETGAATHDRPIHRNFETPAAFSPSADGRLVLTVASNGVARLWDAETLEIVAEPVAEPREFPRVEKAALSPDATTFVEAMWNGELRLRDARTGAVLRSFRGEGGEPPIRLVFAPDGARFALVVDDRLEIWPVAGEGGPVALTPEPGRPVLALAFTPDGARLAAGAGDAVRVYDAATGAERLALTGGAKGVNALAVSPDGARLAVGSDDGAARLWRLDDGAAEATFDGGGRSVYAVAFDPSGDRLAIGGADRTARIFDIESGRERIVLRGHANALFGLGFGPNGERLLSWAYDQTLRTWSAKPAADRAASFPSPYLMDVATDAEARLIALAETAQVRVIETATGREVLTVPVEQYQVKSVSLDAAGRRLLVTLRQEMQLWSVETGQRLFETMWKDKYFQVGAISADGRILAGGRVGGIRLWRPPDPEPAWWLDGGGQPDWLEFSPDGGSLTLVSNGPDAGLWRFEEGDVNLFEGRPCPCRTMSLSPDGRRALVTLPQMGTGASLWDVASGTRIADLPSHDGFPEGADFGPEGRYLLSAGRMEARLWDAETLERVLTIRDPEGDLHKAYFGPDDRTIVTGTSGVARIWRLPAADASAFAWARAALGVGSRAEAAALGAPK